MKLRIKSTKSWEKHLPKRPKRARSGYYTQNQNSHKKKIIVIIWLILAIFLIQSIFQIKYLKIEKLELINNNDLTLTEVEAFFDTKLTATKFFIFKNSNFFLFNPESLEKDLAENYNLDQASIKKVWPDKLQITVKEKISHFIWAKDDSLYLLDATGALNRQIRSLDDKYLIIEDFRSIRPSGEYIFSPDEIEIINQIYLEWMDDIADKEKLTKIVINDNWGLIELHTQTGFYVKLDSNESIKKQINNLNQILTAGNITGVDIDYIDVRFGDKVYFK